MVLPLLVVLLSLLLQPHSTRALLPQQQNSCVSNSRPSYASRSTALDLYRQSGISTSGAVRSVRRSSVLFAVGRGRESSRAAGRGAGGSGRNYRPRSSIQQAKVSRILRDELSDIICSGDIKANSYPPDGLLQSVTIAEIELSG